MDIREWVDGYRGVLSVSEWVSEYEYEGAGGWV